MDNTTHLIKLSVGSEGIEGLSAWYGSKQAQTADGYPRHITRMWPRREEALLNGGSIYWVIKGVVQCRMKILRLDRVTGADGTPHCAIVMEPEIIRTAPAPKRPFQGWRYLTPEDAPPDLPKTRTAEDPLPPALAGALADIGVL